jgi:hypothetical protein
MRIDLLTIVGVAPGGRDDYELWTRRCGCRLREITAGLCPTGAQLRTAVHSCGCPPRFVTWTCGGRVAICAGHRQFECATCQDTFVERLSWLARDTITRGALSRRYMA